MVKETFKNTATKEKTSSGRSALIEFEVTFPVSIYLNDRDLQNLEQDAREIKYDEDGNDEAAESLVISDSASLVRAVVAAYGNNWGSDAVSFIEALLEGYDTNWYEACSAAKEKAETGDTEFTIDFKKGKKGKK